MYGYDSWAGFTGTGTAALSKATKKLSFTINGTTYSAKGSGAAIASCGGGEIGFSVAGTVKAPKADKGQSVSLVACLGAVTGTELTSYTNFLLDLDGPGFVTTAQIEPAYSSLTIG